MHSTTGAARFTHRNKKTSLCKHRFGHYIFSLRCIWKRRDKQLQWFYLNCFAPSTRTSYHVHKYDVAQYTMWCNLLLKRSHFCVVNMTATYIWAEVADRHIMFVHAYCDELGVHCIYHFGVTKLQAQKHFIAWIGSIGKRNIAFAALEWGR